MKLFSLQWLLLMIFMYSVSFAQKMPPSLEESKDEPIRYTGKIQTEKKYYDGSLPHAVGVHHFQVFRPV